MFMFATLYVRSNAKADLKTFLFPFILERSYGEVWILHDLDGGETWSKNQANEIISWQCLQTT